jgi:DUF1680 family protein
MKRTTMLTLSALLLMPLAVLPAAEFNAAPDGNTNPGTMKVPFHTIQKFQLLPAGAVRLNGFVDERIRLMAEVWFDEKTLAEMVDVFRRRPNGFADGEFWGKAVRALSHQLEYQQDPRLQGLLKQTLADLIGTQTEDGCISGYKPDKQPYNTDVWDRKYVLLGLINGYEATRDPKVLDAGVRAADQLLTQLGPPPKVRVMDTAYVTAPPRPTGGFQGIESSSILEPMVRLYQMTGKQEYLDFARYLVEVEGGSKRGSIFEAAFAGKDVRDFGGDGIPRHSVAHAYSVISCFEGLVEFYRATGNEHWKQAILNMYENALAKETVIIGAQCGLGPNDGLASTEQFSHSAFHQTCPVQDGLEGCTHARWMGLNRQLLLLTGESKYADQFERTLYNAFLGSIKPDGQMVDYHTHLNGTRPAKMNYRKTFNGKVITCCIYNVADSLAMIPTVAVMGDGEGAVVNLYIPGTARVKLAGDNEVVLEQTTDYPRTGRIDILVRPAKTTRFPIRLRIPEWSATTLASINGEPQEAKPGSYLRMDRTWTAGDKISLTLDMRCHLVSSPPGSPQSADAFRALVRGPVVLARDKRLGGDIQEEVEIQADADGIVALALLETTFPALMQFAVPTTRGGSFPVVDFASAGNTWDATSEYVTWIPRPGKPSGRWIWFPDVGNPAQQATVGKRWFRRALELPVGRNIKVATATFCADNQFTLYVNGRPVGTGTNWQQPVTMDLQSDLKPGAMVLAVEAANTPYKGPNAAGLLGRVRIEFEEGPPVICFTDGTWKTSDQETPGWQAAGFKDDAWKPARVLGRNGMKPWGALKEFND